MTMNLLSLDLLCITALVLASVYLILPASSLDQWPAPAPQVSLSDEKTRLGSTPPSCHSRCNDCNPCMAVQVPTIPAHSRGGPGLGNAFPLDMSSSSLISNKYSNYKPLGWKCRCGDRLFNP
ncbi:EPIDERMAL PATTERNING FACTOR-like protein 1 [Magnolia sinica]|uniref:EPIDERMAL PATTERNING FACTOR-like protein 1 n=1 Tax=Magnolia sinica TaxID=86752 RepID=UPI0026582F55|nr:EPIDERMAL PATTERNING FACTOR-like protein 1 [Magnolia sinica]